MADKHDRLDVNQVEKETNQLVASYLNVRRAVGSLGFVLPVMLLVFAATPEVPFMPSISEFYYTPVREALVATIGAIAVFLFSYNGYGPDPARADVHPFEAWLTDRKLSFAAAGGALGVAVFPTRSDVILAPEPLLLDWLGPAWSGGLHNASALLFFVSLTVFCLDNFQRMPVDRDIPEQRVAENDIYQFCGVLLAFCTAGLVAASLVIGLEPDGWGVTLEQLRIVFWLEAIGLGAFSFSWLIKGKTFTGLVAKLGDVTNAAARIPPADKR